jgi:DNA polymerase I-like protein with 3'-5' exonuclease and polymerase domains
MTSSSSTVSPRLEAALEMVGASPLVGLDLETTSLDPRRGRIRLIQVSNGEDTYVIDAFKVATASLESVFEALSRAVVVAHNAAFEWAWVYHHHGVALDNVRDTQVMARLVACGDMSVSCTLEAVALRELGLELDKEPQTSDWAADNLTRRQLSYAAKDAKILVPLYESLWRKIEENGQTSAAEIENAALPAVARMQLAGMPVDREAWNVHTAEIAKEARKLNRRMLDAEWLPPRPPTPQTWALQGEDCLAMLQAAGVPVSGTTAKDLEPYADHEIVKRLLAYRKTKGDDKKRANLKASILKLAPEKPPSPAPPWNFGSWQQVQEICYEILGGYLKSIDETMLLRYVDEHPFFKMLLDYRGLKKLSTTYGVEWFKDAYADGRVYPSWWQIGTSTGRFACSNPNAQNVPASHRKFFAAPSGRTFVDVDYSQIEVRVYAVLVGEQALLDIFEAGADVYQSTAAHLLNTDEEVITKEERDKAKAIVLGLLYGLSAAGLPLYARKNYGVTVTDAEAEDLIERFFEVYPNIAESHDALLRELDYEGYVDQQTITGRRRDGITNRNEAINMPIQGSAADGLKLAMAYVYERLNVRFSSGSAYIVAAIHDELLVECDEEDALEVKEIVEIAMVDAMNELLNGGEYRVPVKVSGKITRVWEK